MSKESDMRLRQHYECSKGRIRKRRRVRKSISSTFSENSESRKSAKNDGKKKKIIEGRKEQFSP